MDTLTIHFTTNRALTEEEVSDIELHPSLVVSANGGDGLDWTDDRKADNPAHLAIEFSEDVMEPMTVFNVVTRIVGDTVLSRNDIDHYENGDGFAITDNEWSKTA